MPDTFLTVAVQLRIPAVQGQITVYAKNDFTLNFTLKDADGAKIPLTGCTVDWWVCLTNGSEVVGTRTTAVNAADQEANVGECNIALAAAFSNSLNGPYDYFAKFTDAAGKVSTVGYGTITFSPRGV